MEVSIGDLELDGVGGGDGHTDADEAAAVHADGAPFLNHLHLDVSRAETEQDFAAEAGTRSALALARVCQGHVDGAAESLRPVLDLPPSQCIHKIVTAVGRVRTALSAIKDPGRDAIELAGAIEGWTAERLTLPE